MLHREVSNKRFQIDSLDGLRGVAVLLVVMSHTSNSGMYLFPYLDFQGVGKSGVFLFFILSSFLLSVPLLSSNKPIFGAETMSRYWQRRFFRIYPLFFIYLLFILLNSYLFWLLRDKSERGVPFYLDPQSFMQHLFLMEGKGVTWSIAVEFKFYFLLPIIILFVKKINDFNEVAAIFFLLACLTLTSVLFPASESVINDTSIAPYVPIFLVGISIAYMHTLGQGRVIRKSNPSFTKLIGYLGVAGVTILIPELYSAIFQPVPRNHFHKEFLVFSVFWAMVLLSIINEDSVITSVLCLKLLRFFGSISFSLYLIHHPVIHMVSFFDMNPYLSAWSVLIFSTGLSYLTFRFIELPASKLMIPWFMNRS